VKKKGSAIVTVKDKSADMVSQLLAMKVYKSTNLLMLHALQALPFLRILLTLFTVNVLHHEPYRRHKLLNDHSQICRFRRTA
jgi:hypothetical protein